MAEITWEDPPATQSRGRQVSSEELAVANELVANPERWARLKSYDDSKKAASMAQTIRTGKRGAFSRALEAAGKGRFDAVSRQPSPDAALHAVYVRYTIEAKAERTRKKSKH